MTFRMTPAALWLSSLALVVTVIAPPQQAQAAPQRTRVRRSRAVSAGGTKGAVLTVVDQFERAYQRKDKQTMLMKLMIPTNEANALEKRYQWLRGYGPKDMPGTVHPPILFQTSQGSFVPTSYTVSSAKPAEKGRWEVVVREQGTYRDEDGRYSVSRLRHFKLSQLKGRWWVSDYFLAENAEDYGFRVDDIVDKMTHLGK